MITIAKDPAVIVVPWRADIEQLLPHAKKFVFDQQFLLALPHGIDETRLLRNLDFKVPAPINSHYDYNELSPFEVQRQTCELMTMNPRSYILNEMGTGKTRAAIWAFDFLKKQGLANKMLVVCPVSTMYFTWEREISMVAPRLKVRVLYGTKQKRLRLLADDADVYIINHDGLLVLGKELMSRTDISVMCVDEVTAFRNARAVRTKALAKLVRGKPYAWAMTGSPTPNAPTDIYGIVRTFTPEEAPPSFIALRDETMVQTSIYDWKPRRDAAEVIASYLKPSVRFSLDDVTELPEIVERRVDVTQGPMQRKLYAQLREKAAAALKQGAITAVNGGVVLQKMLQISCGYVYMDDGRTAHLDNGDRLELLGQTIESAPEKVIVFSPWIHSANGIGEFLAKQKVDFETVTGSTPMGRRGEIFKAFQQTDKYKVLNAHPRCMAHGLTLTAATMIVWFAPLQDFEIFEQANMRIRRVGQNHKQQIIMLAGTAAERRVYQDNLSKEALQDNVLNILRSLTTE